jgi:hypothetical protein
MANSAFELEFKPTFRALNGRLAKANKRLFESRRDGMRDQGRRYVEFAREEAPEDTGAFKKGIGFRTFISGNTAGFRVHMPQPLGNFIVKGTKPHPIPKVEKKGRYLWWEGAEHPVKRVRHPGTKANKFAGRAFRRWFPGARKWLTTVSTRYTKTIAGSG